MCAHQIALNVADTDLSASCFQINRRSRRHLNLEIHVAYVTTVAIITHDVDHQTRFGLSGVEMHRGGLHGSSDANLIPRPGLDRDRAGEVFQLNTNILAGGVVSRHALLRERSRRKNEYDEEGRKGCKTYSIAGGGRIKVHRVGSSGREHLGLFSFTVRQTPSTTRPCHSERH